MTTESSKTEHEAVASTARDLGAEETLFRQLHGLNVPGIFPPGWSADLIDHYCLARYLDFKRATWKRKARAVRLPMGARLQFRARWCRIVLPAIFRELSGRAAARFFPNSH
ncbi:MAG: hypothetical protein EPN36_12120 [Rhodanobacteraceae bacterium]|nr:MAG: hypothetical protein EPN36_12120 [Rhodanobacteraceae bacterium]